jgi:hypothetical protein
MGHSLGGDCIFNIPFERIGDNRYGRYTDFFSGYCMAADCGRTGPSVSDKYNHPVAFLLDFSP